jgi:hypothetical protein
MRVSFISSRYCYELEMTEAFARDNRKEAVVVPIILRPCHWTGLPFGQLQAATKDGKPVEKYLSLDVLVRDSRRAGCFVGV